MKFDCMNIEAEAWHLDMIVNLEKFPFNYTYGNKNYRGFDRNLLTAKKTIENKNKRIDTINFLMGDILEITLETTYYFEYGVSEWTIWFENIGFKNSEAISKLESTLTFEGENPVLKGILGDHKNLYRPYTIDLTHMPIEFYTDSGRPTHINFPYFNLEYGKKGVILAIGWAGTWSAKFFNNGNSTIYTAKSTNNINTYLKPGEKIRTALFVRAPYKVRDEHYSTNFWRRWFIDYNLPPYDENNKKLSPFSTCCIANDTGLPNSDGSISERYTTWRPSLEKMIEEDAKVSFRWFDAGWYIAPNGTSPETDWWGTVGTWELDPIKWPGKTFLESTNFARENGMKTLMWFEPERVTDPDSLVVNYGYKREWAIEREGYANIANNIGDPECLKWTTQRICKVLKENKVEMYREDNNSDPGDLWMYLDKKEGENRLGITECKFIMGHYKMWDDIIACTLSYGGCGFVDSCASGGGRNDLESMRRGVPLLRSDNDRTSTSLRLSMTTAFNKWIPFCGANTKEKAWALDLTGIRDKYVWRASYLPILNVDTQFVQDPNQDFDMLRFGLKEWERINPYLLKDFYTHTPWHTENDRSNFTAYSFFDDVKGKGVIFLFRMENCGLDSIKIKLPFVKSHSEYLFTDEDSKKSFVQSGYKIMEQGLDFIISEKRSSRIVWIEKR